MMPFNGSIQTQLIWRSRRLTIHHNLVNDLSTTIIFAQRSPHWDIATIEFLLEALKHDRLQAFDDVANNTFRETLDYLHNYCGSSSELVRSSMLRVELQLNIVSCIAVSSSSWFQYSTVYVMLMVSHAVVHSHRTR